MAPEDPGELSPIERLLRLKRYERPDDRFLQDFVISFQKRQREEMLRLSARTLLWERMVAYWDHLITPRRAFALAGGAALLLLGWFAIPIQQADTVVARLDVDADGGDSGLMMEFGVEGVLLGVEEDKPPTGSSLLLSDHFSGGFADEARVARVTRSQQASPGR